MTRVTTHELLVIVGVLGMIAGCAKSAAPGRTGTAATAAGGTQAESHASCSPHFLNADDVAGILSAPIKAVQTLPDDTQSCEFLTTSYPEIIVSVRPGLGRSTVEDWAAGKMALDSRPLAGVGDNAVWVESLLEVFAQKNAVLCDIQVRADSSDLALSSDALPNALGVLCNKIFAVH